MVISTVYVSNAERINVHTDGTHHN